MSTLIATWLVGWLHDRPFQNFRGSKSVDQRFERGSKIEKGSVGWLDWMLGSQEATQRRDREMSKSRSIVVRVEMFVCRHTRQTDRMFLMWTLLFLERGYRSFFYQNEIMSKVQHSNLTCTCACVKQNFVHSKTLSDWPFCSLGASKSVQIRRPPDLKAPE